MTEENLENKGNISIKRKEKNIRKNATKRERTPKEIKTNLQERKERKEPRKTNQEKRKTTKKSYHTKEIFKVFILEELMAKIRYFRFMSL